MERPINRWREARVAAAATLGMWLLIYGLFLIPSVLFGGFKPWKPAFYAPMILAGLALSGLLYLLVKGTAGRPVGPRIAVLGVAILLFGIGHGVIDAFLWTWFNDTFLNGRPLPGGFVNVAATSTLIYVPLYGFYTATLALISTGFQIRDRERQLAEARAAAHQAQVAALRFQLNPHFLFNTLNALSSLIVTGRNAEAELMTGKLSDFLRASLVADPETETALDDELATLQAYLDIERVRFGDRLAVEVISPAALLSAAIPAFLLQPLVENAIKYAVAPSRKPVTIRVEAAREVDDLLITVADDGGQAFGGLPKSGAGVGLENVRSRLRALYGDRGRLEAVARERGFVATVRLPLREAPVKSEAEEAA